MFWHAIAGGLEVLIHWQTWIGMLIYGALILVPMVVVGMAAERDMRLGCIGMFLLPIAQVFAAIVVLWILLPIILGVGNLALWSMPFEIAVQNPWWMLKITVWLSVLAFLSAFVPIVGRSGTFTNFVVGSFVIASATKSFVLASGRESLPQLDYVPGFWTFVGFLIVGSIVSTIAGIAVAGLSVVASSGTRSDEAQPGPVAMSAIGILGLLPCFMYGAWLGLQVKAAML